MPNRGTGAGRLRLGPEYTGTVVSFAAPTTCQEPAVRRRIYGLMRLGVRAHRQVLKPCSARSDPFVISDRGRATSRPVPPSQWLAFTRNTPPSRRPGQPIGSTRAFR